MRDAFTSCTVRTSGKWCTDFMPHTDVHHNELVWLQLVATTASTHPSIHQNESFHSYLHVESNENLVFKN